MQTVYIDASRCKTAAELHAQLKVLFDLPDYYGGNADALHDCLSERRTLPRVWIASRGEGEAAEALSSCLPAMEDAGCEVVAE